MKILSVEIVIMAVFFSHRILCNFWQPICAIFSYFQPSKCCGFTEPNISNFCEIDFFTERRRISILMIWKFFIKTAFTLTHSDEGKHRWLRGNVRRWKSTAKQIIRQQFIDLNRRQIFEGEKIWLRIINHTRRWFLNNNTTDKSLSQHPQLSIPSAHNKRLKGRIVGIEEFWDFLLAAFKLLGRLIFQHKGHVLCLYETLMPHLWSEWTWEATTTDRRWTSINTKSTFWYCLCDMITHLKAHYCKSNEPFPVPQVLYLNSPQSVHNLKFNWNFIIHENFITGENNFMGKFST